MEMNDSDDLRSKIADLRREFGGLIDEPTLRRIALDMGGINMSDVKKIGEFTDKAEVSAVVKVTKINDIKQFKKRTGGEGRVRNINVEDETGSCRLTLWDDDVELPEGMDVQIGTQLKLTDCYTKQTEFGLDVSKGKKGKVEKL